MVIRKVLNQSAGNMSTVSSSSLRPEINPLARAGRERWDRSL